MKRFMPSNKTALPRFQCFGFLTAFGCSQIVGLVCYGYCVTIARIFISVDVMNSVMSCAVRTRSKFKGNIL